MVRGRVRERGLGGGVRGEGIIVEGIVCIRHLGALCIADDLGADGADSSGIPQSWVQEHVAVPACVSDRCLFECLLRKSDLFVDVVANKAIA